MEAFAVRVIMTCLWALVMIGFCIGIVISTDKLMMPVSSLEMAVTFLIDGFLCWMCCGFFSPALEHIWEE